MEQYLLSQSEYTGVLPQPVLRQTMGLPSKFVHGSSGPSLHELMPAISKTITSKKIKKDFIVASYMYDDLLTNDLLVGMLHLLN